MKKILFALPLALIPFALCGANPIEVKAEEPTSASQVSEQVSESVISESAQAGFAYKIAEPKIGYRDSADVSYTPGDNRIGAFYLSADGWNEGDTYTITLTVTGNITTALNGKILYIYEYRPTLVEWAGNAIARNENGSFTLTKPAIPGEYALSVNFTRTLVSNPVELTNINWESLLTVQNLMTVLGWLALTFITGALAIGAYKTRKKSSTTLDKVKKEVTDAIEAKFGAETAEQFEKLLKDVVGKTFDSINAKLETVDSNSAIMLRCLLLMQEDTPEARLAITELLTKLNTEKDGKAEEVSAMIKAEIEKYKAEAEAKASALEEAKKANEEWVAKAEEPIPLDEPIAEDKKEDDYGTL